MAINRCHRYMDCARLMINKIHYTYIIIITKILVNVKIQAAIIYNEYLKLINRFVENLVITGVQKYFLNIVLVNLSLSLFILYYI